MAKNIKADIQLRRKHFRIDTLRGVPVDDHTQRVDRVSVDEDAHLQKVALAVAELVVIERRLKPAEGPRDMFFSRS